jgi:Flp pilus assembly protein TadB
MMAIMPVVFLGLLAMIDPSGVALLFGEPIGRLILLGVVVLIVAGWWWIRRIMDVEM